MNIGVLALQGAFHEHAQILKRLGVTVREVRLPRDLDSLAGLIIPGGESTTIGKLARQFNLIEPLREFGKTQAIWGTCAGAIFLAKDVRRDQPLLRLMDITVQRNAFGRQAESFEIDLDIPAITAGKKGTAKPFHAIFIRAPLIESVGRGVDVLATVESGAVVAAQQGKLLATSFHPELTSDARFHEYFMELAAKR